MRPRIATILVATFAILSVAWILGCASARPSVIADSARDIAQTTQAGGFNYTGGQFSLGAVIITASAMLLLMLSNMLDSAWSHRREMKRIKVRDKT